LNERRKLKFHQLVKERTMKTELVLCGLFAALAAGDVNAQTARNRGRRFVPAYRGPQNGTAGSRARTMLRRSGQSPVRSPLLRRSPYLRYYRGHNLRTTRGINPHGAIVLQGGGSGGRYATQARQARQARQATQARQYVQPAFRRPPFRFRRR
jgi:hypothetical protein